MDEKSDGPGGEHGKVISKGVSRGNYRGVNTGGKKKIGEKSSTAQERLGANHQKKGGEERWREVEEGGIP